MAPGYTVLRCVIAATVSAAAALALGAVPARAAWDCGAVLQAPCPPSDAAAADGSLPARSPLQPLPAPAAGDTGGRLFTRVAGHLPVGFNESSVDSGLASPGEAAALAQGIGGTIERIPLNWAFTQAVRGGPYDWRPWDARYRAYVAAGIRPIWAIAASPRWAVDSGDWGACANRQDRGLQSQQECLAGPADTQAYAAFAAAVARRYPLSAAVEVWNEPNLAEYWRDPDPHAYAALASTATAAVRQANPAMRVLVGALATAPSTDVDGFAFRDFVSVLRGSGLLGRADGLSFHPYPQTPGAEAFVRAFRDARDALAGGPPVRLVADEVGASVADRPRALHRFTEAEQRSTVLGVYDLLDQAAASVPLSSRVDAVVFHTDVDGPGGFGFVTPRDGAGAQMAPRPVYCAIAARLRATGLCGLPAPLPALPSRRAAKKRALKKRAVKHRVTPKKGASGRACAKARRAPTRKHAARRRRPRAKRGTAGRHARASRASARAQRPRCGRSRPAPRRRRHR